MDWAWISCCHSCAACVKSWEILITSGICPAATAACKSWWRHSIHSCISSSQCGMKSSQRRGRLDLGSGLGPATETLNLATESPPTLPTAEVSATWPTLWHVSSPTLPNENVLSPRKTRTLSPERRRELPRLLPTLTCGLHALTRPRDLPCLPWRPLQSPTWRRDPWLQQPSHSGLGMDGSLTSSPACYVKAVDLVGQADEIAVLREATASKVDGVPG